MNAAAELPAVVVLISGEGTNLQALIDASRAGMLGARIAAAISDRAEARGLDRARRGGIEAVHVGREDFATREAYESALADVIDRHTPRAVVLAGFMRVLGSAFVQHYAGRMLNIHPSLLPRYRGLDTHRRVLDAGEREHGATVHFVTPELDAGPRVLQYRISVHPDDTPETLAARVHRGEYLILPRAASWLAAGRLRLENDQVILDDQPLSGPIVIEEDS